MNTNSKTEKPSPDTDQGRRRFLKLVPAGALAALGFSSCTPEQTAGMGQALDLVSRYGGSYIPNEGRIALNVMRRINSIAQYNASQQQLTAARAKAKASSSSERQYIRVKPDRSSSSTTSGTHVVAYDPKTDKLDDEVIVVSETDLNAGDSVSINGQSGKII